MLSKRRCSQIATLHWLWRLVIRAGREKRRNELLGGCLDTHRHRLEENKSGGKLQKESTFGVHIWVRPLHFIAQNDESSYRLWGYPRNNCKWARYILWSASVAVQVSLLSTDGVLAKKNSAAHRGYSITAQQRRRSIAASVISGRTFANETLPRPSRDEIEYS